jgi:hypothetical protein
LVESAELPSLSNRSVLGWLQRPSSYMANPLNHSFRIGETYQDRLGKYKVTSIEGNLLVYEYADGIQHKGDTETKWRIHRNILSEQSPPHIVRPLRRPRSDHDEEFFTYDQVSPIIVDIVEAYGKSHKDYMTHEKIVAELMKHPAGQLILNLPHDRSQRYWAGVMLACFSKVFTEGRSEWSARFDQKEIDGDWAYRVSHEK